MKTLKFASDLVEQILSGEKTSTWRLFDDKNLQEGDELTFINKENDKAFGKAVITSLRTKTLGNISEEDWEGHERFASEDAMYEAYRKYYGDRVDADTEVKIISFQFRGAKE